MDKPEAAAPFPPDDFPGERISDDAQGRPRWLLSGHVLIYQPDHPLASPKHGTVFEHRMVMHDAGFDLQPGLEVHHRNGDRTDNRIENLVLLPSGEHHKLHQSGFRYRLHSPDGVDLGEATYAVKIKQGQEIVFGKGLRFRVLSVVPFEDESSFVAMLKVEARSA